MAWIFFRVNWRAWIVFHLICPCANIFFVLRPPPLPAPIRFLIVRPLIVDGPLNRAVRPRVVPNFSSGMLERAQRERAWKSPHAACRLFSRGWFSSALALRSLYYPWGKMGTTRCQQSGSSKQKHHFSFWHLSSVEASLCHREARERKESARGLAKF